MASVNRVTLVGYTGKDAELKYLSSGTPLASFSLATSWGSGDNEKTTWHNVSWFGDNAEKVAKWITKGRLVYVEGRIENRSWEDDQGQKHYRTDIVASQVLLLDKADGQGRGAAGGWEDAGSRGARSNGRPQNRPTARSGNARGASRGDIDVDDLPFE